MLLPLLLSLLPIASLADLPKDLDTFLEKLFEFEECEDFVSNADFVSVSTSECKPFNCDFPRQICQRPADKFREESANQCKIIPEKCITAANGGPLPPSIKSPFSLITMPPPVKEEHEEETNKVDVSELCQMEAPTGRFCGFSRKWTYNRDTGRCDQFWFPGCKTRDTNANLFDKQAVCEELALLCRERFAASSTPVPTTAGFSPITLAPSPSRPFFPLPSRPSLPSPPSSLSTGGGESGIFGQPSGSGEFGNNIVSLIAQGFMGGGRRGGAPQPTQSSSKNAASNAFNVLSQFTNFEFGNLPDLLG